jgi:phosphatidate cytidylyltransferase
MTTPNTTKTRILTACGLLAGLLAALFLLPHAVRLLLCLLLCGAAAREWGGLARFGRVGRIAFALLALALCIVFLPQFRGIDVGLEYGYGSAIDRAYHEYVKVMDFLTDRVLWLALAFWLVLVPCWLHYKWRLQGVAAVAVGLVVLVPFIMVMMSLVQVPQVLLMALSIAWVADIAAYFVGRAWGRHKLAPNISPGKTWEGAAGAVVAVMVYGMFLAVLRGHVPWKLALIMVVVTAVSIMGDLFGSLLKRQAGVKDSGRLLPGHSGILDRIGSQTATLPVLASLLG